MLLTRSPFLLLLYRGNCIKIVFCLQGHCLLEMPSGTGKTTTILSLDTRNRKSYRRTEASHELLWEKQHQDDGYGRTSAEFTKELNGLTASYVRERHQADSTTPVCQYYEGFDIEGRESFLPPGIYNLDDLKQYGRERNWCPYFLTRFAINNASIIVYSYHYLLDPKIAEVVSKQLQKEVVVVFDEAHNIGNVQCDTQTKVVKR